MNYFVFSVLGGTRELENARLTPGGVGESHTKKMGALIGNLKRSPKRCTRSCFFGYGFNFFKPQF